MTVGAKSCAIWAQRGGLYLAFLIYCLENHAHLLSRDFRSKRPHRIATYSFPIVRWELCSIPANVDTDIVRAIDGQSNQKTDCKGSYRSLFDIIWTHESLGDTRTNLKRS